MLWMVPATLLSSGQWSNRMILSLAITVCGPTPLILACIQILHSVPWPSLQMIIVPILILTRGKANSYPQEFHPWSIFPLTGLFAIWMRLNGRWTCKACTWKIILPKRSRISMKWPCLSWWTLTWQVPSSYQPILSRILCGFSIPAQIMICRKTLSMPKMWRSSGLLMLRSFRAMESWIYYRMPWLKPSDMLTSLQILHRDTTMFIMPMWIFSQGINILPTVISTIWI